MFRSLVFLIAGSALAESLPNPDVIRMQQESFARETAIAHRMALAAQPKSAARAKAAHMKVCVFRCGPSKELRRAVREYIKTDHPMPIFWEPKQ